MQTGKVGLCAHTTNMRPAGVMTGQKQRSGEWGRKEGGGGVEYCVRHSVISPTLSTFRIHRVNHSKVPSPIHTPPTHTCCVEVLGHEPLLGHFLPSPGRQLERPQVVEHSLSVCPSAHVDGTLWLKPNENPSNLGPLPSQQTKRSTFHRRKYETYHDTVHILGTNNNRA